MPNKERRIYPPGKAYPNAKALGGYNAICDVCLPGCEQDRYWKDVDFKNPIADPPVKFKPQKCDACGKKIIFCEPDEVI